MTIWIRYTNQQGRVLQASMHTDECRSSAREDHEALAVKKLLSEYPAAKQIQVLPPLFG